MLKAEMTRRGLTYILTHREDMVVRLMKHDCAQ